MPVIECELRSLLDKERFDALYGRLVREGEELGTDEQVTYYFDGPTDLRIQENGSYAKVWLKKGQMHDEAREEIEIRTDKADFGNLKELFLALGHTIEIEWYRTRHTFRWKGIDVMLDHTRGYGYIIELEKCCDPERKTETLDELHHLLDGLGIAQTPTEEFEKRFDDYRRHWRTRIAEDTKKRMQEPPS